MCENICDDVHMKIYRVTMLKETCVLLTQPPGDPVFSKSMPQGEKRKIFFIGGGPPQRGETYVATGQNANVFML